jgi:hypothetical protein
MMPTSNVPTDTPPAPLNEQHMSQEAVAQYIQQEQQNRRGGFSPRPVFVQKLNEFGSPNLAVLTFEQDTQLTVAGLLQVVPDDHVIVYDDSAPCGAQYFHGIVTEVRDAHRPSDSVRGMRLLYINKAHNTGEPAAENTAS